VYQYWTSSTPVVNSKSAPPTRNSSERRSSACATERTGGQVNSLGRTDHSLPRSTGMSTSPSVTCTPCVSR
jgi:hypothetical protein